MKSSATQPPTRSHHKGRGDGRQGRDDTVAPMRIREVMTQAVITAEASDTLQHVGELMRDRNVGSVVVCDGGRAVGVITDRDLALALAADGVEVDAGAGDYASRPLVTGQADMEIEEAVGLMVQHRIPRLPVTAG